MWWSAHAGLTPDGTVQAVWAALDGLVPSKKGSWGPPGRDVLRAAQDLDAGLESATADVVLAWWQESQDAAYGVLLRMEKAKLEGVTLTSQTGRTPRLRPPKFRLLPEVTPDGVRFMDTPEPFQAELLRHAQKLHCGHAGLLLDLTRLQAPVRPDDPADDLDFVWCMRVVLPRPPEPPVTGAPPKYHNMEHAVRKGSPATSLHQLPRPPVSTLPGFGLRCWWVSWRTSPPEPQPAAVGGAPPLPRQETPGVAGAQQQAGHAGALPAAAGDGTRAGSEGQPRRTPTSRPPRALCLPAANVWPDAGLGLPLAAGHQPWGSLVGRLG